MAIKGSAPVERIKFTELLYFSILASSWCLWSLELGEGIWMVRDLYCYVEDNSNFYFSFHFKVIICCISTLTPHNKLYFLKKWVKSQMRYYLLYALWFKTTSWVPGNCFVQVAKPFFWQPCWGSKQCNFFSKNLLENRVKFPKERNAFFPTCDQAIFILARENSPAPQKIAWTQVTFVLDYHLGCVTSRANQQLQHHFEVNSCSHTRPQLLLSQLLRVLL